MKNENISIKDVLNICNHTDHTNLSKTATIEDIERLCDEAKYVGAASVCVAPYFVSRAKEHLKDSGIKVCTVIGFPNGYSTTKTKMFEAQNAIENGTDEIDMVLNLCQLKNKRYHEIETEITALSNLCHEQTPKRTLKVIVETCLLSEKEICEMCELCIRGGADYIKTSTGFDKSGAKINDIKLMKKSISNRTLKIKASGGIHSVKEAKEMIDAGADRIGTSAVVKDAIGILKRERDKEEVR